MLIDDVRRRLFSPTTSASPRAVGVELELIPADAATLRPVQAADIPGGSVPILARLGERAGWKAHKGENDPPSWMLGDGSRVSFEPGGQIEISSAPLPTASEVIDTTTRVAAAVREELAGAGVELLAKGVDPNNDIAAVPLQLRGERYTRMTDYFNAIGPSGIRMMRQTAALQISVERGNDPIARWRLLNALAPIVVALFANSRRYAGVETGFASYRAHLWRTLDPSRTGIVCGQDDAAREYLRFALEAGALRSGGGGKSYVPFRELLRTSPLTEEDWQFHLSTLFPEVRPREYFELRSADTIEIEYLPAPIVFVTALVYDPESARDAERRLGAPSAQLLERAGNRGLGDPELHRLADKLAKLALRGAESLGGDYVRPEHVRAAGEWLSRALDGA